MEIILVAEDRFIANKYTNYSNLQVVSLFNNKVKDLLNVS